MGGDPEHLDHLAELLTRYPNLYLDTSATKWIVRELGKQQEAAREFFRRWADRICFGTDQVVLKDVRPGALHGPVLGAPDVLGDRSGV